MSGDLNVWWLLLIIEASVIGIGKGTEKRSGKEGRYCIRFF